MKVWRKLLGLHFIKLIPQVAQYGLLNLGKPYQSITIITLMIYGLYCKVRGYFIQRLIQRCLLQRDKL